MKEAANDWQQLSDECRKVLPFDQFIRASLQFKQGGNGNKAPPLNHELKYTMGKVTIPSFYGSSQMSSSAWLQKLSVYFQLNPMVEEDELKMVILHIEGEYSDWWFHGIITLVHDHILSYEGFSNALMERFERKDPELPFKELAQLKQVGTPESYMLEFEKISVMVSDVSMARLVLLFTGGLI